MFYRDGDGHSFRSESHRLVIRQLFFHRFVPVNASDHSSTTYKLELLKNCWVHVCLPCVRALQPFIYAQSNVLTMGGATLYELIGTHFHTTKSDKRMHLITTVSPDSALISKGKLTLKLYEVSMEYICVRHSAWSLSQKLSVLVEGRACPLLGV